MYRMKRQGKAFSDMENMTRSFSRKETKNNGGVFGSKPGQASKPKENEKINYKKTKNYTKKNYNYSLSYM